MRIPLIRPRITDDVKQRVADVLDSGYLTEGPVTRKFEQAVADSVGAKHGLAVTSCTTGLELALRGLGIGAGDEVIVPDYTYPATASVVNIVGATAVLVDVDAETMLIDYDALEAAITPKTRVVIPVSLFGNPLDYERLASIKEKHGLFIIEDAACALGASYKGQRIGSLADMTVFSFHPRKFVTTGEGGLITTDNKEWIDWMHSYKHFGTGPNPTRMSAVFTMIGTNYKLSNVLAAIGLAQMEDIDMMLARRQELAAKYTEKLSGIADITFPKVTAGGEHSYQSYCIFVDNREAIMNTLRDNSIEAQIGTFALHMHPAYLNNVLCRIEGSMARSREVYNNCLTLPLYHDMTEEEMNSVVSALDKLVLSGNQEL